MRCPKQPYSSVEMIDVKTWSWRVVSVSGGEAGGSARREHDFSKDFSENQSDGFQTKSGYAETGQAVNRSGARSSFAFSAGR